MSNHKTLKYIPLTEDNAVTSDQILEAMKDSIQLSKNQELLTTLPPPCQERIGRIRTLAQEHVQQTVRTNYAIGLEINQLYDDLTQLGEYKYGARAVDTIANLTGLSKDYLYCVMNVVDAFCEEAVEQMCLLQMRDGGHLSWTHLRALATIENDQERESLLKLTMEKPYTCRDLEREIRRRHPEEGEPNRGRPSVKPENVFQLAIQALGYAEKFEKQYRKVWHHYDCRMDLMISRAQEQPIHEDQLGLLLETIDQLEQMVRDARFLAGALRQAEAQLRLPSQPTANATSNLKSVDRALVAADPQPLAKIVTKRRSA